MHIKFIHQTLSIALFLLVAYTAIPYVTAAVSATDEVSEAQLKSYMARQIDSDYTSDASGDFTTSAGRVRAVTDILLERRLAQRATAEGLTSPSVVAARLKALRCQILGDFAQDRINSETTVTQQEIVTAYGDNPTSFTREEIVRLVLCQVRLTAPSGDAETVDPQAALERARVALTQADKPPYTLPLIDGVTSGQVTARRGELPPEVEAVIFSTPPGEVTAPIRRTRGAYVARVLHHQKAGLAPLDEVREDILGDLWRANRAALEKENLRELEKTMPLKVNVAAIDAPRTTGTTVLATVGDVPLTLDDAAVTMGMDPAQAMQSKNREPLMRTLDTLAFQTRVATWAERQGIASEQDFLIQFELDRNKLLSQILLSEVSRAAAEVKNPTEDDLKELLRTAPPELSLEKRAQYAVESLTLVPKAEPTELSPTARDDQNLAMGALAEQLRERAAAGEAMRTMADEFEHTSFTLTFRDLGTAPEGPRGHRVDRAVAGLKKGEVSAPVKTKQAGVSLFKLANVVPARAMSIDADREELENIWRHMRALKARQKLLEETEQSLLH